MTSLLHIPRILLMFPTGGASGAGQPQADPIMQFAPILLIVVVFYFFIIRPQNKRRKERETLVNKMEKGDKVITSSGIHGTVSAIEEGGTILVQVSDTVKLRFEKSAVSTVVPK